MALLSTFANSTLGSTIRATLNNLITRDNQIGWGNWHDSAYTSGLPLSLLATTPVTLPNNGLGADTVLTQLPPSGAFYDTATSKVFVEENDGVLITLDLSVRPTAGSTTYGEVWFAVNGSTYHRNIFSFPKGNNVTRPVSITAYVFGTADWETLGGIPTVETNGPAEVFDVQYHIQRVHFAR